MTPEVSHASWRSLSRTTSHTRNSGPGPLLRPPCVATGSASSAFLVAACGGKAAVEGGCGERPLLTHNRHCERQAFTARRR